MIRIDDEVKRPGRVNTREYESKYRLQRKFYGILMANTSEIGKIEEARFRNRRDVLRKRHFFIKDDSRILII